MIFASADEVLAATAAFGRAEGDRFIPTGSPAPGALVDRLAHTAALGGPADLKGTARWVLRSLAAAQGIRPSSIQALYTAMGREEAGGFTVPAMNVRAMTYYTARAAFRAARRLEAGALIFEISRSEIGYTEQRPHEYAAVVTAAALREGFTAPIFIQGDHLQVSARQYHGASREAEIALLEALIREEIAAGFYNIDIDTSTLVDLEQPTLEAQQALNCELAAVFTRFCRDHEPRGVTLSLGGEIGEVGGRNSDVHELRAFMKGYAAALERHGGGVGISKISVQTGTAHGGFVGPDGKVRMDVALDLDVLGELSTVARREYGLAGAVQHGASTLPPDAFGSFPRAGACEIHLATDFQNVVYDHPEFPEALKQEMYGWLHDHAAEERKPNDTDRQFIYRARKKALGPFKSRLWTMPDAAKAALGGALEERFAFLMQQLQVADTAAVVHRHVTAPVPVFSREADVLAAAGQISAAERKAEGLAD
jgi:fructose/tagatose bisphosphate aldolase